MLVLSGRELNLNLEMKAKKYDMNKRHPSNFGRNFFVEIFCSLFLFFFFFADKSDYEFQMQEI